jgi:hypothetical protein
MLHFPHFGILYQEKSGNPVRKGFVDFHRSQAKIVFCSWLEAEEMGSVSVTLTQGDQIGRIFGDWVDVSFGHFFKYGNSPNFKLLFSTVKFTL